MIGLWTTLATVLLVALRRRIGVRPTIWLWLHNTLALVVVISSTVHALMIDGTMGIFSKWILCLAAVAGSLIAVINLRLVEPRPAARDRENTPFGELCSRR